MAGVPTRPPAVVVMGVQGSGKSTIGRLLAERLGVSFLDGDDLHPAANKQKMASGAPLTDEDRVPWLTAIGDAMSEQQAAGAGIVVACSALKRWYRELLRSSVPDLRAVWLRGDVDLIASRLEHRDHEFMPPTLLASQFETLQPLAPWESGIAVSVALPPAAVVDQILTGFGMLPAV